MPSIPRWRWWTTLALAATLGLLQGMTAAWQTPAPDVAAAPPAVEIAPAVLPAQAPAADPHDALRGRFWRPHGSDAMRPEPRLEAVQWAPMSSYAAPRHFIAPFEEAS